MNNANTIKNTMNNAMQ